MVTRLQAWARRRPSLPLWLLGAVLVISFAARLAWVAEPCHAPCRTPTDHLLIFDEDYYVNAARVIDRIAPPAGAPYANSPLATDPNSEHPPLAKLLIAGGMELFGDGPFAWRFPSVLLGTVAILGMFALVRAAGGGRWTALGAAALMAADNLMLVHGRIGTLDIYAVAAMVWAAALYLRGRPILAGVVVGVGACAKEVTPYVLFALVVLEALRWAMRREGAVAALRRLGWCFAASAGAFLGLLTLLYRIVPPYDPQTGKLVSGLPFGEVGRILSYAAHQTSPNGPKGIASYPWDWLVDIKPITYLRINPGHPTAALNQITPAVHFLGMISPPILLLAIPSMVFAGIGAFSTGRRFGARDEVGLVGLAWFLGTYLPFVLLSLLESRTSYLYYMVIVMPGIYMAVADLIGRIGAGRILCLAWMGAVLAAVIVMYPFTPLP
ncbi:MAG TPA: glycosyltransferase family 39 protein [Solirubrobacteraceae bacterium]|nr:glycosyltransferase family 39 protein [Solirubrobacteraceae bacterium]